MADKKQYQPLIDFINERAAIWQERLCLSHWHIDHAFLDSYFGDDGEEDFKITATTEGRWNYFQAKIKWYMPSAIRHNLDEIERCLVHELCHVILLPEQVLIDVTLETEAEGLENNQADSLTERYHELLELSTEMATRAIWKAWEKTPVPPV